MDPTTMPDEAVTLHVVHKAEIDRDCARAALVDLSWLGQPVDEGPGDGWHRIATDLELPVQDGSGPAVRKAAVVDLGEVHETRNGLSLPIAWRSASFTPLFPVFAGQLEITKSSLVLTGRYAPPFGQIGLLMDQALLHFVATRTAKALLATLARPCRRGSVGIHDR
jgi:hypothetical protein